MLFNDIADVINKDVVLMPGLQFFKEPVKKESKLPIFTRN